VNTTREPAPFPDWLGFPSFARLSVACHHDRLLRDTALSVERLKVWGIMPGRRLFVHVGLSQYELGTTASVVVCSPYTTDHTRGRCGRSTMGS